MPFAFIERWRTRAEPVEAAFDTAHTQALALAVLQANIEAVKAELAARANPNVAIVPPFVTTPRTLLQHAVMSENAALVSALLHGGADPMATTPECFWPAPHLATLHEQRECLTALMADPRSDFDYPALDPLVGDTSTARQIAARRKRPFADWFGQHYSLTEVAAPPVFESEEEIGLAKWRARRNGLTP
jgi:hypothetical protein